MGADRIRTEEIPRRQWPSYFEAFSRRHDGWLVDVEELLGERGALTESAGLPFRGATAVLRPTPSVTIDTGRGAAEHVGHRIDHPKRVWIETLPGGAEAALEIESSGGRRTLVVFRSPQPVEAVDGLPAPSMRRQRRSGKRR